MLGWGKPMGATLTNQKSKIAELQERVKAKDSRIKELKAREAALNERISVLAQRDIQIAELNVKVAALEEELFALKNQRLDGALHQIATDPFGRADAVGSEIMANVLRNSDMRGILSYRYLRGEGLEVGALHFPLPLPPTARAKYYDYRTAEESRKIYGSLPPDKIVDVDYVGDGEKLELVADDSLDFLIANHMLEHCQDFIGTLRIFYGKLRAEGVLFISLPDLRYTFDYRRKPTSFEHLVRDNREGPAESLYEHYRELDAAWEEKYRAGMRATLGVTDEKQVLEQTEFAHAAEGKHIDWHFHAWTQAEILDLFVRLGTEQGFEWEIETVSRNGIEVIVVLRKTSVEAYDRAEAAAPAQAKTDDGKKSNAEAVSPGLYLAEEKRAYRAFLDDHDDPIISVEETWRTETEVKMRGWVVTRAEEIPEIDFNVSGQRAQVTWSERPDLATLYPEAPAQGRRGFSLHAANESPYHIEMTLKGAGRERQRKLIVPATGQPDWPYPSEGKWEEFLEMVDRPGMSVLEIGSRHVAPGTSGHRADFKHARYVGFDYHPDENTDVVGDAHLLSRYFREGERFDAIFSLAVLEHLAMPWQAVIEMNRMLKMGAVVYHSVPFSWPWHEAPWDFWRFSHHGLGVLFSQPLGFEILKSGLNGPARIVPTTEVAEMREFWACPAYFGAQILARKVAEVDEAATRWNVAMEAVVEQGSSYPKPATR